MAKKKKIKISLSKVKAWKKKNWKKVVIGLGVLGLLIYFRTLFVVAWVNGRPISRMTYVSELERVAGTQALDGLMTKALIVQEGKKQKVKVSKSEVDEEIVKLEELAGQQGMSLDQLIELQGINRASLTKDIGLQKILEKLIEGDEVSEEDVQKYIEDNMELVEPGTDMEAYGKDVKEMLKNQQLTVKVQELIQELQEQASVVSWL